MAFSDQLSTILRNPSRTLQSFIRMLEPVSKERLEAMAQMSRRMTRQNFGKAIRMFAPLYLSNECINSCAYCGFSRGNAILRVTLEIEETLTEARHLAAMGFRSILLVAGEHPKYVSNNYLGRCIEGLAKEFPSIAIEVAPMETKDYRPLVEAGAEGVVVYQETYHADAYARYHLAGPKKNYAWRMDTPERAYAAGFRKIGIGALFGLWDWKEEAIALAAHVEYLQRTCWKAALTISLPRLRPAAGGFEPPYPIDDLHLVQLLCAMRITFPTVGIVLSTREHAHFRNAIAPLGVTVMSAGSHTEPGGYTGQGKNHLHQTVRGRQIESEGDHATPQFEISDERTPEEVAHQLKTLGLDPVWKDWDASILAHENSR